jgi:hypothetical protein
MMKEVDPVLSAGDAEIILRNTANESPDPKVTAGYVDALRALMAVRANQAPTIQLVQPAPGSSHSYRNLHFSAIVTDPDPGAGLPVFDGQTTVLFEPAAGGFYCSADQPAYHGSQPYYECDASFVQPGTLSVQAVVTDPFGATATATAIVNAVETDPTITRVKPASYSTFYATQLVRFEASVSDPDEDPFPADHISWYSSNDGPLGTGAKLATFLSEGTQTITVIAVDELGHGAQRQITLYIQSGAGVPSVIIQSPDDGSFHYSGEVITFSGHAQDDEDGTLHGTSLAWYSDIDGFLGYGESFQHTLSGPTNCNQGAQYHTITLTATDSNGHSVSDQITVLIGIFC